MNKRKNQTKPDILLRSVGSSRTSLPHSYFFFPNEYRDRINREVLGARGTVLFVYYVYVGVLCSPISGDRQATNTVTGNPDSGAVVWV